MKKKILVIQGKAASGKTTLLMALNNTFYNALLITEGSQISTLLFNNAVRRGADVFIIDAVATQAQLNTITAWHKRQEAAPAIIVATQAQLELDSEQHRSIIL